MQCEMCINNSLKVSLVRTPTIIGLSASTAPVCPPIGLAYLKRVISNFTKNIEVVDSIGNFPEVRPEIIKDNVVNLLGQNIQEITSEVSSNTDFVLISCMFSQDWVYAKELIKKLKDKCSNAVFIIGGEHVTALPLFCLDESPELDVVVLGEGESTVVDFFKKYISSNYEVPTSIAGTFIRLPDGNIKKNERNLRIKNIDNIQRPDWDGFPLLNYFDGHHGFGVMLGSRSMPIMASRGCPYKCTFCSSPSMWTTLWKSRKPQEVFDEIKLYKYKYNVDNFDFYDLTAIVKRAWIVDFCNLLIENNLDITWQLPSGTRSEALDKEVTRLLYKSGCRNLSYAPESGSKEVLTIIKKCINIEDMLKSMKDSVSVGMNIKANIICGFPDEKISHLFESLKFIVRVAWIGCHDLSINQYSPYPGSELYEKLIREGKILLDDSYFFNLSCYSSMSNAVSYSQYLSNREILVFKLLGTVLFYMISFSVRPWRLWNMLVNVFNKKETSRLEKTINSYMSRRS